MLHTMINYYKDTVIMVGHQTFDNQSACLSDQNIFWSDIKDRSNNIGRGKKLLFILITYSVYLSNKNSTLGC